MPQRGGGSVLDSGFSASSGIGALVASCPLNVIGFQTATRIRSRDGPVNPDVVYAHSQRAFDASLPPDREPAFPSYGHSPVTNHQRLPSFLPLYLLLPLESAARMLRSSVAGTREKWR
jgi:hypothetical protein